MRLSDIPFSNSVSLEYKVNVIEFGAVGDGINDDTDSINAAAQKAVTEGKVFYLPPREYKITSTVVLACNVEAIGATLNISDTSKIALQVGKTDSYTHRVKMSLPSVKQGGKAGPGWSGNDVGIKVVNLSESSLYVPYVYNFSIGLWMSATGARGTCYNTVELGYLHNNKVSLQLKGTGDESWVNSNTFMGGRFEQSTVHEGTNITGCRQLLLTQEPTSQRGCPNNNQFYGLSLEGNAPEYHLECAGSRNMFSNCRWEAQPPKVYWSQINTYNVAEGNKIIGGYDANNIVFTKSPNSLSNDIWDQDKIDAKSYTVNGTPGKSVTFTTNDGKTITVNSGIITDIV